jgi:transposase InsO family protein
MESGIGIGRKRVARLMAAAGISGVRPRKRDKTTIRIPVVTPAADLVERQFRPDRRNVLWVADITYLRTGEGWLYLAAVQDAYSRHIIGWSMATHMRSSLVVDALKMALARRRPDPGLIHHSDRGSPNTYRWRSDVPPARPESRSRLSSGGDAYDNAVTETFFATLKKELANPRGPPSRLELQSAVFEYIEAFLQPPTPALHPGNAVPRRLRTPTTLTARWLRSIARTTTSNKANPVSRKPGRGPSIAVRIAKWPSRRAL